jgi:hypothetical protein
MIPGVTIEMGGQEWQVPPLTLGQLRRLWPKITDLTSQDTLLIMDAVCEIVAAALSRNYPDMTIERVADLIDLENRERVVNAVMGGSGFLAGEAGAVSRANGAASTASSPPLADTPTPSSMQ